MLVLLGLAGLDAIESAPKVHVYSRHPAENGKQNFLNCFVEGFQPPNIQITLLKNDEKMDNVEMDDLSFREDWKWSISPLKVPRTSNGMQIINLHLRHICFSGLKNFCLAI
ncbi:unnamed protein product [Caretta caretta]